MGILTQFISKKFAIVLIPLLLAWVRGLVCGKGFDIPEPILKLVWGYLAANVFQTVAVAWINRPKTPSPPSE